jgi:hypothetical protein
VVVRLQLRELKSRLTQREFTWRAPSSIPSVLLSVGAVMSLSSRSAESGAGGGSRL